MTWKTITEQPGYFGRGRDKIIRENNEHYGEGNWRTVWRLGFNLLDFDQACQVYQAGYFVDSFNREG